MLFVLVEIVFSHQGVEDLAVVQLDSSRGVILLAIRLLIIQEPLAVPLHHHLQLLPQQVAVEAVEVAQLVNQMEDLALLEFQTVEQLGEYLAVEPVAAGSAVHQAVVAVEEDLV
jgi:hypothetical protein